MINKRFLAFVLFWGAHELSAMDKPLDERPPHQIILTQPSHVTVQRAGSEALPLYSTPSRVYENTYRTDYEHFLMQQSPQNLLIELVARYHALFQLRSFDPLFPPFLSNLQPPFVDNASRLQSDILFLTTYSLLQARSTPDLMNAPSLQAGCRKIWVEYLELGRQAIYLALLAVHENLFENDELQSPLRIFEDLARVMGLDPLQNHRSYLGYLEWVLGHFFDPAVSTRDCSLQDLLCLIFRARIPHPDFTVLALGLRRLPWPWSFDSTHPGLPFTIVTQADTMIWHQPDIWCQPGTLLDLASPNLGRCILYRVFLGGLADGVTTVSEPVTPFWNVFSMFSDPQQEESLQIELVQQFGDSSINIHLLTQLREIARHHAWYPCPSVFNAALVSSDPTIFYRGPPGEEADRHSPPYGTPFPWEGAETPVSLGFDDPILGRNNSDVDLFPPQELEEEYVPSSLRFSSDDPDDEMLLRRSF